MGNYSQHSRAFRNAVSNYNFDNYDWNAAAQKLASGEISFDSAMNDWKGLSVSNIQTGINMLTAERNKFNWIGTKWMRINKVIVGLKALHEAKVLGSGSTSTITGIHSGGGNWITSLFGGGDEGGDANEGVDVLTGCAAPKVMDKTTGKCVDPLVAQLPAKKNTALWWALGIAGGLALLTTVILVARGGGKKKG